MATAAQADTFAGSHLGAPLPPQLAPQPSQNRFQAQAAAVLVVAVLAAAALQTVLSVLTPLARTRALSALTSDRDQAGPAPHKIGLGLAEQHEAPISLPVGQRHLPSSPHSPFWGAAGERWRAGGPLPNFSFAGDVVLGSLVCECWQPLCLLVWQPGP